MSAQWKPGDVARHPQGFVGIFVSETSRGLGTGCTVSAHEGDGDHWHYAYGGWDPRDSVMSRHARPLVVIDPEDAEQVERLIADYVDTYAERNPDRGSGAWGLAHVEAMQAALRDLARPTPPRPEEPMGLGAVVEDAEGGLWVRTGEYAPWRRSPGITAAYSHVGAVRVLSEGVQA